MTLSDLKELEAALKCFPCQDEKWLENTLEGVRMGRESAGTIVLQAARAFYQIAPLLKEMMEKREKAPSMAELRRTQTGLAMAKNKIDFGRLVDVGDITTYTEARAIADSANGRAHIFYDCAANTATEIGRILK